MAEMEAHKKAGQLGAILGVLIGLVIAALVFIVEVFIWTPK